MDPIAGSRTLTLPRSVSGRPEPLAELARRCYPDAAIRVEACPEGWSIGITPVSELTRVYDPALGATLSRMGTSVGELMAWHRLSTVGEAFWLEAMFRPWALYAWSHWIATGDGRRPLIVNVARSDDLRPSTLVAGGADRDRRPLVALMEEHVVDLKRPQSVRAALNRLLVGVDAYIPPFLLDRPGDVVQLTEPPPGHGERAAERFDVSLPCDGEARPLKVEHEANGRSSYRIIDHPDLLAKTCDGHAVLLTVDLSSFRLVPRRQRGSVVPSWTVDDLVEGIRPMADAIRAVTLAYAPGACPSPAWSGLVDTLRTGLIDAIGAGRPAWRPRPVPSPDKVFTLGTHRAVTPDETLRRVTPHLAMIGITRVADITGLDRVGIPVMAAYRPEARSVAVSLGKGATADAARASAVMESVELWHAERPALRMRWGSAAGLAGGHRLVDWAALPGTASRVFDEDTPTLWVEAESLVDGHAALVPYESVHADGRVPEPNGSGWFLCTSNGLASGNTMVEARTHALCELIERDAVTLWQIGADVTGSLIDPDSVNDASCRDLLARFRAAGLDVVLCDATSDVGISVAVAIVFDEHPDVGPQMGMGCHPARAIALSRALTEAAQSRLTLISGARDDVFRERYATAGRDPTLIRRFSDLAAAARRGRRFDAMPDVATASLEADHQRVVAALVAAGLHPYAVDLGRPEFGIDVVRAIVPGLEPPAEVDGYRPGRRALAILERRVP